MCFYSGIILFWKRDLFFVFCGLGMAYTFRVSASKCGHQNAQRQIATFVTGETLADVSKKVHPDEADELESLGFIGQEETGFEIDWAFENGSLI